MRFIDEQCGSPVLRIEQSTLPRKGVERIVVVAHHQIREARGIMLQRCGADLVHRGNGLSECHRDRASFPGVTEKFGQGRAATVKVPTSTLAGVLPTRRAGRGADSFTCNQLDDTQRPPLRIHSGDGVECKLPSRTTRRQIERSLAIESGQTTQGPVEHTERLADPCWSLGK